MTTPAPLRRWRQRVGERRARWWVVTAVVSAGLSFSIVYSNVQSFDPVLTPASGYTDATDYLAMYAGEPSRPEWGIRAYRPLVPELARLLPDVPRSLFSSNVDVDLDTLAAAKFGAMNLAFLIGACLAMFALQLNFGFDDPQAFVGVVLFLSMREVVRSAGLPMVDTAFYLFFILVLIAVQRDRPWMLFLASAIGVAGKELILLAIPLILLTTYPWKRRLVLLGATLPAVAIYGFIRLAYGPGPVDGYLRGESFGFLGQQLRALFTPNGVVNVAMTFGICWILAAYALFKADLSPLLRRWAWLIPIVVVGVLAGMGNLGRSTFTAFPVVISLAVAGLWTLTAPSRSSSP